MQELCELVINGYELSQETILENGYDINELLANETIKVSDGRITLSSYVLYKYGLKLQQENREEAALVCFEKCHELNPTDAIVVLQLLLDCLNNKDYRKAYDYLMPLLSTKDEWLEADLNMYLYILSFIAEVPNEYRYYVEKIREEHLICRLHKNSASYQKIRKLIYNREFDEARNILTKTTSLKDQSKIRFVVLDKLLEHTNTLEDEVPVEYIEDLEKYLSNDNLSKALKTVRDYLHCIDRNMYEFVIVNLIKAAFAEQDFEFTKALTAITDIDNHVDSNEYIIYFYEALEDGLFDACKAYLTIINGLTDYELNQALSEALSQKMECEKGYQYRG